jgi:hypothetical protein
MGYKPRANSYKLNVDACFFTNGIGVHGAVLRNDKGEAVAGSSCTLQYLADATTIEATFLQLIEQIGCTPVMIESGSLELVQAFNGSTGIWSPYIANRIGPISMRLCFREGNKVVMIQKKNWDCDPPSFIIPDVMHDVTLFKVK